MTQNDFVTIYTSFNDLATVRAMFPLVLAETKRADAALIVHDCSTNETRDTWEWYREMAEKHCFVHLFSSRLPFAVARNMCLSLAMEMFVPQYVCMLEDDHAYGRGAIDALRAAVCSHYGRISPNGLKYGMFSLCPDCWGESFRQSCLEDGNGNLYPAPDREPSRLGGANSCCRCAPASHWMTVLKGYDVDEYPISYYQTRNLNIRNYNRGFTTLYVGGGRLIRRVMRQGNGTQLRNIVFDPQYTLSDMRCSVKRQD